MNFSKTSRHKGGGRAFDRAFCTSRHSPVASWGTKGKDFLPELKILLCATYGNKEKHTTVDFPVCY